MKINGLAILTLFVVLIVSATMPTTLDAKVAVKDVEYLKGKDFVQLHFVIDKLIPIPEVKYLTDDHTAMLVTIPDVDFSTIENTIKFNSPIIDNISIIKRNKYADVSIKLKQANKYRIFSNVKGLYVEFPMKQLAATQTQKVGHDNQLKQAENDKGKHALTLPAPLPTALPTPRSAENNRNAKTKPALSQPSAQPSTQPSAQPRKQATAKADTPPDADDDDDSTQHIKRFRVIDKGEDRIAFAFDLTGKVDYNVLPIRETPVRLAVDFKNTRAASIKESINHLNVKKVRGAFNSPTVYRVVFDLDYLKHFNVSCDDKQLTVEFFNKENAKKNLLAQHTPNKQAANKKNNIQPPVQPAPHTVKPEPNPVAKSAPQQTPQPKALPLNKTAQAKPQPTTQAPPSLKVPPAPAPAQTAKNQKPAVINNSHVTPAANPQNPGKKSSLKSITFSGPGPYNTDDFFADEQSQTANTRMNFSTDTTTTAPDEDGGKTGQISFLRNTIETGRQQYSGEPMNFFFKNADLENVILFFAKVSGLSIVIDPGVTGTVTARMYQVPWDQALSYFLKVNGLDMVLEGNLLRIGRVEKLAAEAQSRRKLKDSRELEEDLTVFSRTLSYAKVGDVTKLLRKQLSKRGEIMEDGRSNTLIISEVPDRIERIDKLIDTLDVANRQVSIEARIVETNSNYTESLGIQWGYGFAADAMYGNQTSLKFPNSVAVNGAPLASPSFTTGPLGGYAVNLPASGANSGTVFSLANVANTFRLDVALSAMEQKGQGRIISSPKTTTQNNMKASIMQGKQIPVQTIQNNTITVKYFNAMLELNVTPQITAKGTVIVNIDIKNNAADFANLVNQIPPIITQSIETTVMVNDGGTIVIGGMYKVEDSHSTERTPFFSKIPLLGNLFKNSTKRREQKELLVFITPRIIK